MRYLIVAVLGALLSLPAVAQDFNKGLEAAERGDYATALREWRPLAEQGNADAQYNLGIMYHNGKGVPQDNAEAARLYRTAAEQGDANAQFNLGVMYNRGEGVPQNYTEAVKWYRTAAEQGNAEAQYNLGLIYYEGRGVRRDYAEAMRWHRKAAEWGQARAQNSVGAMYADGEGVPQDYVQAHMWFNLAAAQGDEVAVKNRDTIAKLMTQTQVADAQRLARAWRPEQHDTAKVPRPLGTAPATTHEKIARIQHDLAALGYDPGPTDGLLGPKTRAALRAFQAREGLSVTGAVSEDVEVALRSARGFGSKESPTTLHMLEMSSTGSGFYVSVQGHILTNAHVVRGCTEVRVPPSQSVSIIAQDEAGDLALLRSAARRAATHVQFREGRSIRPGDDIMVVGYPLQGIVASEANVTSGNVSALAGPGNDQRLFQITAPIQLGNSGGPVVDMAGNAVGVVVGKLNAIRMARAIGDIPQNVNFAISAGTTKAFLDAQNVPYATAPSTERLDPADVAAKARAFTVLLECWR